MRMIVSFKNFEKHHNPMSSFNTYYIYNSIKVYTYVYTPSNSFIHHFKLNRLNFFLVEVGNTLRRTETTNVCMYMTNPLINSVVSLVMNFSLKACFFS